MTGARSGGRRSSGSRAFCRREVQTRLEIFSPESADFRATGGPQIGPLSWRLGPPRFGTYPPRVAIFAPKPPSKTHDLGMAPIIPKSCVLDRGFGAKMTTRGGYVPDLGGPNRYDRGPIWEPTRSPGSRPSGSRSSGSRRFREGNVQLRWGICPAQRPVAAGSHPRGRMGNAGKSGVRRHTSERTKKRRRTPRQSYIFFVRQSAKRILVSAHL